MSEIIQRVTRESVMLDDITGMETKTLEGIKTDFEQRILDPEIAFSKHAELKLILSNIAFELSMRDRV